MQRKFYIIGHNPNTIDDVINCLRDGANAIEPDVHYLPEYDQKFFMYDWMTGNPLNHTLEDYLKELSLSLDAQPSLNLALIAFDLKTPDHPDKIDKIIYWQEFFTRLYNLFLKKYPIPVLLTGGEEGMIDLLIAAKPFLQNNQAVGIDEHMDPSVVEADFKKAQIGSYTYANGISFLGSPTEPKFKQKIDDAINRRDTGNSFKLVYAWTVKKEEEMILFLDDVKQVDGMITSDVSTLNKLITSSRYSTQFTLATKSYNPFLTSS